MTDTVIDYDKLRNGVVDEKIWSRDEVLRLLPYHICFSNKNARAKSEDALYWLLDLKHRWNLILRREDQYDYHILAFAREEDAIMFALRCL